MSSPRWISDVMTSRPSVRAVAWTSRISSTTAGPPTLAKIANRRRPGTTSRKKFESLGRKIGLLDRQAGDVAARFSQTCDQAIAHRVDCHRKNNRNGRCHLHYCGDSATNGDNNVHLQADKLSSDFGVPLGAPLRPAILDCDVTVLDPA